MAKHEVPVFMRGTTAWSFYGYVFAEAPPIDLLAPEALASANPWIVFAAVLEHAKRGNRAHIPRLQACFASGPDQGPDRASLHLTGDAGRESDLAVLKRALEYGTDAQRAYAAEAAAQAGRLWLVPSMLQAWKSVSGRGHHETIGFAVSSMLESPGGPIAAVAGLYPYGSSQETNFGKQTLERISGRKGRRRSHRGSH